jgi:hypothetical protein
MPALFGASEAFGSPSRMIARIRSCRPSDLYYRISSFTQCDLAELGEQSTTR